ncbi:MAG: amino acid ABC transporter substrate-binding protein [Acetobacteraceae bacterium]|nr:amino acid ABC transporter substrate-binding protein [Acetobacteraceae bacterium]
MFHSPRMTLAAGIATLALAMSSAVAQQPKFYVEMQPDVANCGDPSYENAVKNGISLGFNVNPPEAYQDASKQPTGIDWDINKAVLDVLGIKKISVVWMPWESVIPALLSHRIDVIGADIHVNPERIKVISFSGPAWWYGPVLIVRKGNPLNVTSYDQLKGKKVGTITGSAADLYLRRIGVQTTEFKQEVDELQSLNQGRLDAVLEDDVVYKQFDKENPNNNLDPLWNIPVPTNIIEGGGYGMARFGIRKQDCSLRAAYTGALAEIRANGEVSYILKKYGLSDRNLVLFTLHP